MPPHSSVNSVTVALAVGVAGAAGWLGWQAVQSATVASTQAQQTQDEQRRKECATASDSVLTDFKARLADFKQRTMAMPQDPAGLWERCDFLEERIEQLWQALRIRAKTPRA